MCALNNCMKLKRSIEIKKIAIPTDYDGYIVYKLSKPKI